MTLPGPEPTHAELTELSRWLTAFDAHCARVPSHPTTHLIVTPLGAPDGGRLQRALALHGVVVRHRLAITAWPRVSTALQVRARTPLALRRAVLFERAWRHVSPAPVAEAWELSHEDAVRLAGHKRQVRQALENVALDFGPLLPRPARLHAFHLPDPDDLGESSARLFTATTLLDGGTGVDGRVSCVAE